MSAKDQFDPPLGEEPNNGAQVAALKNLVEQLQVQLSNTKSELEFSKAETSNLQKQNEASQQAITSLQKQVEAVVGQVVRNRRTLSNSRRKRI